MKLIPSRIIKIVIGTGAVAVLAAGVTFATHKPAPAKASDTKSTTTITCTDCTVESSPNPSSSPAPLNTKITTSGGGITKVTSTSVSPGPGGTNNSAHSDVSVIGDGSVSQTTASGPVTVD